MECFRLIQRQCITKNEIGLKIRVSFLSSNDEKFCYKMSSIILDKPPTEYQFFIFYSTRGWSVIPSGYEKYITNKEFSKEESMIRVIIEKETQNIIYYLPILYSTPLARIEEMIMMDKFEGPECFKLLSQIPFDYFSKLKILLENTKYRDLSHHELVKSFLLEFLSESKRDEQFDRYNFFIAFHNGNISNCSIDNIRFIIEDSIGKYYNNMKKIFNCEIIGLELQFKSFCSLKALKEFILCVEIFIQLPYVNKIKLQKIIDDGQELYERIKDFPFDE